MITFGMLLSIVSAVWNCPDGNSNVLIKNCLENRKGFCCNSLLHCSKCLWKKDWVSSPRAKASSAKPGPSGFDVNVWSVFTFREMGTGYKALLKFAQYMNMPGAITKTRYQAINDILHDAYQVVADESVISAGREAYEQLEANTAVKDCQVSVDGTWQKRGFSSLNGVVTALSPLTGKCLDVAGLSKICKSCQMWSKKENHPKYNKWKETHNCHVNHTKSSGAMESTGAIMIFQRSVKSTPLGILATLEMETPHLSLM